MSCSEPLRQVSLKLMQICVRCAAKCLCFVGWFTQGSFPSSHPGSFNLYSLDWQGSQGWLVKSCCAKSIRLEQTWQVWLMVVYLAMTQGSRCCWSSFKTLIIHCFQWRLGDLEAGLAGSSPPLPLVLAGSSPLLPPVVLPCHTQETLMSTFHCTCSGCTLQLAA